LFALLHVWLKWIVAFIWWFFSNLASMFMTHVHWKHWVALQKGLHQLMNDGPQQGSEVLTCGGANHTSTP
jgi:hypothetical protein